MEAYPKEYINHNLPFIALSGLEQLSEDHGKVQNEVLKQGQGVKVLSDLPPLDEAKAGILREEFLKTGNLPWSASSRADALLTASFNVISAGRQYTFPPRKAAPPPQAPSEDPGQSPTISSPVSHDLHSPLSPLSPSSSLFPDGVLSPQWLGKHQRHVPSVFVSFLEVSANQSTATLQDNEIKNEVNSIKNAISRSGFRTRFAAVLVSDKTIIAAPELEERVSSIRRATGLDLKTSLFFLPPPGSRVEIAEFVKTVLSALQPACIEYYRELTKHARRKKTRGYVPPATGAASRGTSQSLSSQGWNARYEFKQGVFAEFRQEMDAAERHYSLTIEELFNPEGILENTPSWSSRWDEARCLTDITAIRVLRCQLWRGLTSGAAESWVNYKARMMDLVDRRGKGTNTYGWAAWEARWAEIMAQLLVRSDLEIFRIAAEAVAEDDADEDLTSRSSPNIFAIPEKGLPITDRLPPFHFMHHPGYWYRVSSKRARSRRRRAMVIPEEDRTPPDQTPASLMANRVRSYDTYMVPLPHEEYPLESDMGIAHVDHILDLDERAALEYGRRRQNRAQAEARLDQSELLAEQGKHQQVVDLLRPFWDDMAWRRDWWWDLAARLIHVLQESASAVDDEFLLVELKWERMCQVLPLNAERTASDFSEDIASSQTQAKDILMDSQKRLSPVIASFAFASAEGHVGDSIPCQMTLLFQSKSNIERLKLSSLEINFNGNPHSVLITHQEHQAEPSIESLALQGHGVSDKGTTRTLTAAANLNLFQGTVKVLNFLLPLRDAGPFHVVDACLELSLSGFKAQYLYSKSSDLKANRWWLDTSSGISSQQLSRDESHSINVLPKAPKMMLQILNMKEQYFTNEKIQLDIDVSNGEVETVSGSLSVELMDSVPAGTDLMWADGQGSQTSDMSTATPNLFRAIDDLASSNRKTYTVFFNAPTYATDCSFSIMVNYSLRSDPETPVSKTLTLSMAFIRPFETDYDLLPRLDIEKWPSLFSMSAMSADTELQKEGAGIIQRWELSSNIASLSTEALVITSASITMDNISSNISCDLTDTSSADYLPINIKQKATSTVPFIFNTRRMSLDDRRASALDLSLAITWHRASDPDPTTTTTYFEVPKLTISGPEPRVLCTTVSDPDINSSATITYTLENASMHFLTFNLTMDATEQFAFSGPKFKTLSLTPMSRVSVDYRVLVHEDRVEEVGEVRGLGKGRWISPSLKVVDAHFQKTLRVLDAGKGVRTGRKGGVVGVFVPG